MILAMNKIKGIANTTVQIAAKNGTRASSGPRAKKNVSKKKAVNIPHVTAPSMLKYGFFIWN